MTKSWYGSNVQKNKTFQDVVDLARDLYDFCADKQEEKEEMPPMPQSKDGEQSADREIEMNDGLLQMKVKSGK